ncbi:MAG: archaetidylserine decarboxylase [Candidatus Algichlamydia australiensis]|nr:archaetidylserine decarboxylase [Chlamydiales bacterium]
MKDPLIFKNRNTKALEREKVYGEKAIKLLYQSPLLIKIFTCFLLPLIARFKFLSNLYGRSQRSPKSKKKILPFIERYQLDATEFQDLPETFVSFDDFFTRKLKPERRPLASTDLILPADGRYLVYPKIDEGRAFKVKGQPYCLEKLLRDKALAKQYIGGALVIARLAPVDYHRFHFPCDCIPEKPQPVDGPLFSVNPLALKKNIGYLIENKRVITKLKTDHLGTILFIEVGATYVGTIHQTFQENTPQKKGDEKGFFSFGGSSLLLLFEPNKVKLDQDLIDATQEGYEMKANFGESLGVSY